MKKRLITMLLAVVMIASLFVAMAATAYANDGMDDSVSVSGTQNSEVSWSINERLGYSVTSVVSVSGLPAGLTYYVDGMGRLIVTGVPAVSGSYRAYFTVEATGGYGGEGPWGTGITVNIYLEAAAPAHSDYTMPTYYGTIPAGVATTLSFPMDCPGYITQFRDKGGSLPDGMYGDYDIYSVKIIGTPTKAGTYTCTFSAYNSLYDCWATQTAVITVTGAVAPKVTKNPTGETVNEGGSATFIAKADNATSITWRIVSADTKTTYNASDASKYFSGLKVSGANTNTLTLSNIPLALNGWSAEAKFESAGGTVFSKGAVIKVNAAKVNDPKIINQPHDSEATIGEKTELNVSAASPDGVEIRYQWFKNSTKSNAGGTKVEGATSSALLVTAEEQDAYYYCEVTCVRNGVSSGVVKTECAVVSGIKLEPAEDEAAKKAEEEEAAKKAEEEAKKAEAEEAAKKAEEEEAAKKAEEEAKKAEEAAKTSEKADHTVAFIIGGVAAVAIICATLIIIQTKAAAKYPDRYSEQIKRAEEYRAAHTRRK